TNFLRFFAFAIFLIQLKAHEITTRTKPMIQPVILEQIKFAVRETTAFVAHSFAPEDKEIVDLISQFLTKLGLKCDSGRRPEPKGISEKVRERILGAEL